MEGARYDDERLARLLRILRPAPCGWVAKAKRIPGNQMVGGSWAQARKPLTDRDVTKLRRALDADPKFRRRFDVDPVAAAEEAGMPDVAVGLDQELRELISLAERVAGDDAFRAELEADPVAVLAAAGVVEEVAEQLLDVLDVSEDVLAKLPEVVAHGHGPVPCKEQLVTFLLESTAVTETIRAAIRGAR